ncbi:hypothetical protein B0H34DRAFT_676133 [Crassisporium funariophilum]|nr:hypothetical protein B0H34DRAFT_676133 [Crassisporium funariophilum]
MCDNPFVVSHNQSSSSTPSADTDAVPRYTALDPVTTNPHESKGDPASMDDVALLNRHSTDKPPVRSSDHRKLPELVSAINALFPMQLQSLLFLSVFLFVMVLAVPVKPKGHHTSVMSSSDEQHRLRHATSETEMKLHDLQIKLNDLKKPTAATNVVANPREIVFKTWLFLGNICVIDNSGKLSAAPPSVRPYSLFFVNENVHLRLSIFRRGTAWEPEALNGTENVAPIITIFVSLNNAERMGAARCIGVPALWCHWRCSRELQDRR